MDAQCASLCNSVSAQDRQADAHFRKRRVKPLLLPTKRYVLLKRFTAKEERRRLVAGIVETKDSYSSFLGLENHLNYVYRASGEVSRDEAFGLEAMFNPVLPVNRSGHGIGTGIRDDQYSPFSVSGYALGTAVKSAPATPPGWRRRNADTRSSHIHAPLPG